MIRIRACLFALLGVMLGWSALAQDDLVGMRQHQSVDILKFIELFDDLIPHHLRGIRNPGSRGGHFKFELGPHVAERLGIEIKERLHICF